MQAFSDFPPSSSSLDSADRKELVVEYSKEILNAIRQKRLDELRLVRCAKALKLRREYTSDDSKDSYLVEDFADKHFQSASVGVCVVLFLIAGVTLTPFLA